ncbi:MAG: hypothetical protein WBE72_22870 [Terracidiphilus sp.]
MLRPICLAVLAVAVAAYRNREHSKVLRMAPSYDRSGGVGFRCVVDAQ